MMPQSHSQGVLCSHRLFGWLRSGFVGLVCLDKVCTPCIRRAYHSSLASVRTCGARRVYQT
eukprot:4658973-Amphidinium_carterae.1